MDTALRIPSGSLVFTCGSDIGADIIKKMQRSPGEPKSMVSHVGIVVEGGRIQTCEMVEALLTVRRHRLWDQYHGKDQYVAIFKPQGFGADKIFRVCLEAETYVGRRYGVLKIAAHAIDYCCGGRYIARRLCRMENYPICSWVTAHAWDKIGYRFLGLNPNQSQPDDQWDHCKANPEQWQYILQLQRI